MEVSESETDGMKLGCDGEDGVCSDCDVEADGEAFNDGDGGVGNGKENKGRFVGGRF